MKLVGQYCHKPRRQGLYKAHVGALIEAGLDYSLLNLEGTTVKGYLRGGAEVWGGNRGTNWRASGGVTFQL